MSDRFFHSCLLALLCYATFASAQISPGKLSKYHAELEGLKNCTQCHQLGKDVADDKCLNCHSSLKSRIDAGLGYHSSSAVKYKNCSGCHSDHHGVEFELVFWKNGIEKFSHDLTGYRLEGKHQISDCRKCHVKSFISSDLSNDKNLNRERTYLGLSGSTCVSCHVDEHVDQMSDDCLKCHDYKWWKPASGFSHDSTRYRLTGKHVETECLKCHPLIPTMESETSHLIPKPDSDGKYARYSNIEFSSCKSCHKDTHLGKFGDNCEKCHTTTGFNDLLGGSAQFDHSATDYPLKGKHVNVECGKCHTGKKLTDAISFERCIDCHKDSHNGQFARRTDRGACESCHTVSGFSPSEYTLQQHQESSYPLTGSHLATPCIICHRVQDDGLDSRFRFKDMSCKGCHKDIHEGQADKWVRLRGCEHCHTTASWSDLAKFDHDSSRFRLVGKHRHTACVKCHQIADKLVLQPLAMKCAGCHEDIHRKQFEQVGADGLVTACDRCHRSEAWKQVIFDHNRDSRYKLDGAHQKVECARCHQRLQGEDGESYIVYKPIGVECADCHGGSVPKGKIKLK